ncbi:MAG: tape measure protein [Lewinellaceae bacterium]|nr:tape measure protein [Lewinellaceae bacterium]
MATIADLNVRLGLVYKNLDDGLKSVERKLKRSGRELSQLGSDLTVAISAPLAALGVSAIKSAADLESLQLAMAAQIGSAEDARKEIELLRKEALKPGLGFEQAVRGSLQLQAVGFSAEFARKTISAFGNALALAGKGKQELDGVALALTQISAKGKVSAEEINQIAERLPQIRTAMKAAFGSADTEVLQKAGISSEKFIAGIVAELEKLPPATGGIKNSIENAGDAVKQFLGSLGVEINKAFDLKGVSERLSRNLASAAAAFAGLDDSTKRTIVSIGLAAVAAGPLIKVYGVLKSTLGSVIESGRGLIAGLKSLSAGALNAIVAFQRLNLAIKLTVIGAAIAAVTALYLAYDHFANSLTDAERAQIAVSNVHKQAADAIVDERTKAELLIGVLKDQTASREDQKRALKELQAISPQYFGNLDLEKSKVSDINTALNNYTESLLRAARAQAAFEQIKQIEKDLNNLKETAQPTFWQEVGNAVLGAGNSFAIAGLNAQSAAKNYGEQKQALEAQRGALLDVIKNNADMVQVVSGSGGTIDATKRQKGAVDDLSKSYRELDKQTRLANRKSTTNEVKGFKNQTPSPTIPTLPTPGGVVSIQTDGVDAFVQSITIATDKLVNFKSVSESIGEALQNFNADGILAADTFAGVAAAISSGGTLIQQALGAAVATMGQLATEGAASFADLGKAALSAAAQIIKAAIATTIAKFVAKQIGLKGLAGLAVATAGAAVINTLFNKLVGSVKAPALADGGVITGPTFAQLGEYPGARFNPEIAAPENKLASIFREQLLRHGMGGGVLALETRLRGDDIYLSQLRTAQKQKRTR